MGIDVHFSAYKRTHTDSLILRRNDLSEWVDDKWEGELNCFPFDAEWPIHNFFHKLYVERGGKMDWVYYGEYLRVLPEDLDALEEVMRKELELVKQVEPQFTLVSLDNLKEFYEKNLHDWIKYARDHIKAGHTVVFYVMD